MSNLTKYHVVFILRPRWLRGPGGSGHENDEIFVLFLVPGSGATIQGIIHGVYWGLGMAVGGVLGGVMVHVIGARLTFRLEAAFSFAILVFFFAINNFHEKSTRYSQIPSEPQDQETGDDANEAVDSSIDTK